MTFRPQMNKTALNLASISSIGNLAVGIQFLLEDFEYNNHQLLSSKPIKSILQCHLFTHFQLITLNEHRMNFPSHVGTYLLFNDMEDDFEVIYVKVC